MKKIVACLDVDGVLFPFWEEVLFELMCLGIPMHDPDKFGWDFLSGITQEQKDAVLRLCTKEKFTEGYNHHEITPYAWANGVYNTLNAQTDLYIATSAMSVPYWCSGRDKWLYKYFDHNRKKTIYTDKKHMIDCHLLIDDRPKTIIDFEEHRKSQDDGKLSILVERPYSKYDPDWAKSSIRAWKVCEPKDLQNVIQSAINKFKDQQNG